MNSYLKQTIVGLLILAAYLALRTLSFYIFILMFGAGNQSYSILVTLIVLFDLISIITLIILRSRVKKLSLTIALALPLFALTTQFLEYFKIL
jgi:hypothetical protein